ncbi:MAG: NAD-dependent epimerase/dehydratase family protein, partial [Pelagibacterales bacterium]|nr:NAD-dependent epimerase/dehydratase family protein [Pelagibacterales bacterium]
MKILVTGALGQIGSELTAALKKIYGDQNVVTSDVRTDNISEEFFPYESLNVLDKPRLAEIVKKHQITTIYHLAAILSAAGEKNPQLCWDVNMTGLHNVLEVARELAVKQIICPSSIAVFGPETPRINTPQETIILPKTMYGLTKAAGELLCDYYVSKFGIDVRGIRYPGLISYKSLPGGGTTDYAVEIFYEAIKNKTYKCFLKSDTVLPMMYMADAIRGTIQLAETDFCKLKNHSNFNFAGISFSCEELAKEIKKYIPEFTISYEPDFRQKIADSWPYSIDDSESKKQWGWKVEY